MNPSDATATRSIVLTDVPTSNGAHDATVDACCGCHVRPVDTERSKTMCTRCLDGGKNVERQEAHRKRCNREGCKKRARIKYCCADCRIADYNERRSRRAAGPCGICGESDHIREHCTSPAARLLPALRDVASARRCSGCDQTDHDFRKCPNNPLHSVMTSLKKVVQSSIKTALRP